MPKRGRAATAVARESAANAPTVALPFIDALNGATIVDVPIDDINLDDTSMQFRVSTRTEDLRSAIERDGQIKPVDLFGSQPYRIIDGFRRVQAIKDLGWPVVKAVVHRGITEDAAHQRAFVSNVVRKNLSALDRANAIRLAKKRGLKSAAIADAFGLSEKQIRRYEVLLDFAPAIKGLLDSDEISMAHAKLLNDFAVTDVVEWAEKIQTGKWSATHLRRELRKLAQKPRADVPRKYIRIRAGVMRFLDSQIRKDAPPAEKLPFIAACKQALKYLQT